MHITVVGAGIVGCAIAHELAARGARVDLIDSRGIGRGATRASAGILAPHIEGHIPALHDLASRSLAMYEDFVRRVERDSKRSVEYKQCGTLQVALDQAEAAALSSAARALEAAGVACSLFDRQETRRFEPRLAERLTAGLLVPAHGYVRASALTEALAGAAMARGVRFSNTAVLGIEGSSTARVTTTSDVIESDAVVVASGSWSVPSRPSQAPPITPIRGQLLHLRADGVAAASVIWGSACYVVPWSDGSVLVGATVEDVGFDERSTADGVRGLLTAAIDLLPSLADAHFDSVRVGFRPRAMDELPIIGRSDTMPGVFYALGHYRNGVLLAPLTAALMGDLVLDGKPRDEIAAIKPGRLAPV